MYFVPLLLFLVGNTKERGLLSDVEWQYWLEHYKLPKTEVPFLPQSEFLTLPPLKVGLVIIKHLFIHVELYE